jgi:hypothetical protein
MKISKNYFDFIELMDQHYPRFGEQYRLPFPYEPDQDDGTGFVSISTLPRSGECEHVGKCRRTPSRLRFATPK